jgi:hypothetical protein
LESVPTRTDKSRLKENGLLFICGPANNMPKPIITKKIPPLTPSQMEEIFMDRLADLIVRLLDYRYEQKEKEKQSNNQNEYEKPTRQQQ